MLNELLHPLFRLIHCYSQSADAFKTVPYRRLRDRTPSKPFLKIWINLASEIFCCIPRQIKLGHTFGDTNHTLYCPFTHCAAVGKEILRHLRALIGSVTMTIVPENIQSTARIRMHRHVPERSKAPSLRCFPFCWQDYNREPNPRRPLDTAPRNMTSQKGVW